MSDSQIIPALITQAARGDQQAAGELFAHFHDRLLKMVRLRMNRRLDRAEAEELLKIAASRE
jgi:hypothetical protein